jgi:hypothetical protein
LPAPVTIYTPTDGTIHQFATNGLTSLGTFTGAYLTKVINLSLLLEGLYNGAGKMRQAMDAVGSHWPTGIADHITVELHNSTTYSTIVYTATDVPLSITGSANVVIPAIYNGSYFITIKHRNSIETTTLTAISFAGSTINQSYGAPANVFGGNLGLSLDNYYLIYAGDVNHDGVIDSRDFSSVDNDSFNYVSGYISTDVDGNGIIDTRDFNAIDNSGFNYISTIHP